MFGSAQEAILLVLGVAAFALEAYALLDALRYSPGQYLAAGKRTKTFWTVILAAAAAVGFLTLPPPLGRSGGPLGLLGLAAVVVASIYLVDARPALQSTARGPRRPQRGGW